jgi:glycosyltransferase involved in cell wall biosynthesis
LTTRKPDCRQERAGVAAAGPSQGDSRAFDVSVVVTTYNHAHFLVDALDSIMAQTARPGEVIVVDDGSRDDPAAVVAKYSGVRLIVQHNQGLAAARNTGWRAARGRYVVFLDADDRLTPDAIACNLHRFARSPGCAFVYGGHRWIDQEGRPLGGEHVQDVGDDPFASFLRGNCVGMHAAVMYRRDCIAETGGFDASLRACEDYDLYLRLARRYPVASGRECLAEYRRHGSNMSHNIPLMLGSALLVLRRQRVHAGSNRRWRAAYRQGIREWKRYYAQRYKRQLRAAMAGTAPARPILRQATRMIGMAPWTALRAAAGGMARIILRREGTHGGGIPRAGAASGADGRVGTSH